MPEEERWYVNRAIPFLTYFLSFLQYSLPTIGRYITRKRNELTATRQPNFAVNGGKRMYF